MASSERRQSHLRPTRKSRSFIGLVTLASWILGFGAGAWAMLDSMNPSSETLTPLQVDLSDIPEGGRTTVYFGLLPIYIAHRTPQEIESVRTWDKKYENRTRHPFGERDERRVHRDEWLVVIGVEPITACHVDGQTPSESRGEWGGWYSSCSGLSFDGSGRAKLWDESDNLKVPIYRFVGETRIEISPPLRWK